MPLTQGAKVFLGAGAAAGAVYLWRARRARAEAAYLEGGAPPPQAYRDRSAPRGTAAYRIGSGEQVLLPPSAAHRAPGVVERVGDAGAVVDAHAKAAVKVSARCARASGQRHPCRRLCRRPAVADGQRSLSLPVLLTRRT